MASADDGWDDVLLIGGVGLALFALFLTRVEQTTGMTARQTVGKLFDPTAKWKATFKGVLTGNPTAGIGLMTDALGHIGQSGSVDPNSEYARWASEKGLDPLDPSTMGQWASSQSHGNVLEQAWGGLKSFFS